MKENHTLFPARVVGFLMALALSVGVLAGTIWVLGTNAILMQRQFERFAPQQTTGLAQAHYPGVAAMLTGYLAGDASAFQYTVDGVPQFQPHEQVHMADCQALFRLDRTVLIVCALLAALLLAAAIMLDEKQAAAGGFFVGSMAVAGVVIVVGLIGALDFDRIFVLFHQLSFDNDLWLLNPATDLLIRLMPTALFVSYAAMGLGVWLAALVLMIGVSARLAFWQKHTR